MIIEFWKTKENPITCYHSRKNKEMIGKVPTTSKKHQNGNQQPVMVEFPNGEKQEYKSVLEAATAVEMKSDALYAMLNGRKKNLTEYKIYKSIINQ